MDGEGCKEKQTRKSILEVDLNLRDHADTTTAELAVQKGHADGLVVLEEEATRGSKVDVLPRCLTLSQESCSSTVGTFVLALSTRKSNKAENYRAYIFC